MFPSTNSRHRSRPRTVHALCAVFEELQDQVHEFTTTNSWPTYHCTHPTPTIPAYRFQWLEHGTDTFYFKPVADLAYSMQIIGDARGCTRLTR